MPQKARIYQPSKTAMQSGRAKTKYWLLEFVAHGRFTDPLMGWSGSTNTLQQLRLRFASKNEAIAYAEREGISYTLEEPKQLILQKKTYASNFDFGKIETYQQPKTS